MIPHPERLHHSPECAGILPTALRRPGVRGFGGWEAEPGVISGRMG